MLHGHMNMCLLACDPLKQSHVYLIIDYGLGVNMGCEQANQIFFPLSVFHSKDFHLCTKMLHLNKTKSLLETL